MGQQDGRLVELKAAVLPGAVLYGLIGWILLTNTLPVVVGLPFAFMAGAAAFFLRPLLIRFCHQTQKRLRFTDVYRPSFFRFYLDGTPLAFAHVYNYVAVGLFVGGWLFLMVHAFA